MSVLPADLLAKNYKTAKALGQKEVQCDAYFEIEGHEELKFLAKTFPRPVLASAGVIESYLPNGIKIGQPQQLLTLQSHEVSFTVLRAARPRKPSIPSIIVAVSFNQPFTWVKSIILTPVIH